MRIIRYSMLGLLVFMLVLLAGCGNGNDNLTGQFRVDGTIVNTAGAPVPGAVILLFSDGSQVGQSLSEIDGAFTITDVPPGTYSIRVIQNFAGTDVVTVSGLFSVTTTNIQLTDIFTPTLQDVSGLPLSFTQGTLLVFGRDANDSPVDVTVQVDGIPGTAGPDTPIVLPQIPTGTRNVTVSARGQTIIFRDVPFFANTITVLNARFSAQVGVTVQGTVLTSAGVPASGLVVLLQRDGITVAQTNVLPNGTFSFPLVTQGVYRIVSSAIIGGVPVQAVSTTFTVSNANVVAPLLIVPTAFDLSGVTVSPTQGTLIVFARNLNNFPVQSLVQVTGVIGTFGPGSTVVVPAVPLGTATVTANTTLQTITIQNVPFQPGTVTAVTAVFTS